MLSLLFGGKTDPAVAARLARIERKLDVILEHLGVEFDDSAAGGLSPEVRAFADSGKKIEAIKAHREATGLGLKEALDAVNAYMAGRS